MKIRGLLVYVIVAALVFFIGVWIECKFEYIWITEVHNSIRYASGEIETVFRDVRKYGTEKDVLSYLDGLEFRLKGILIPDSVNRTLGDAFALQWQKWLWQKESL